MIPPPPSWEAGKSKNPGLNRGKRGQAQVSAAAPQHKRLQECSSTGGLWLSAVQGTGEEESALDFSWHRSSLVKKHSPSGSCDKSRLVATTLMRSMARSHHLLIQLTCLQLTCFPHLTAAEAARTRFLGQSQPSGIPRAKPDAVGMQAPWETLAQQSLLFLWFGCGNYPRRSNSPGEVYHSQHTKPALNQRMFQSAHGITGTSNQEGAGAGPEDNFCCYRKCSREDQMLYNYIFQPKNMPSKLNLTTTNSPHSLKSNPAQTHP